MDIIYPILKLAHIIGFAFVSIPLFNLMVVNERALMGGLFNYATDRYMENIIKHGASRCYVFQATVLIGFAALFSWRVNKTLILFGWV
ncbi:MAG: hypothetical protein JKX73_09465 [Flavobacteriales bacterium]|nr:hypothetical protein [Flavobacteriales bacterium]